jgi:hypothetical protein
MEGATFLYPAKTAPIEGHRTLSVNAGTST